MSVPILTVDAFTDRPFAGNPAGVVWLEAPDADHDASWMQAVAAELNLSETAFVSPHPEGFSLRWFTPETEVPLCGHATLASAHALFSTGRARPEDTIRFQTASGELTALQRDRHDGWIELDFPSFASEQKPLPKPVADAANLTPVEARLVSSGSHYEDWLVALDSEAAVRAVAPDFRALLASDAALLVTAPADSKELDFVSRFFAPCAGIDEDPVTGFAHCCLAPFWGERLGKREMTGFQASKRGGTVRVVWQGERTKLRGRAVTVIEGTLHS